MVQYVSKVARNPLAACLIIYVHFLTAGSRLSAWWFGHTRVNVYCKTPWDGMATKTGESELVVWLHQSFPCICVKISLIVADGRVLAIGVGSWRICGSSRISKGRYFTPQTPNDNSWALTLTGWLEIIYINYRRRSTWASFNSLGRYNFFKQCDWVTSIALSGYVW